MMAFVVSDPACHECVLSSLKILVEAEPDYDQKQPKVCHISFFFHGS